MMVSRSESNSSGHARLDPGQMVHPVSHETIRQIHVNLSLHARPVKSAPWECCLISLCIIRLIQGFTMRPGEGKQRFRLHFLHDCLPSAEGFKTKVAGDIVEPRLRNHK